MAFENLNPAVSIWRNYGLDYLLLPKEELFKYQIDKPANNIADKAISPSKTNPKSSSQLKTTFTGSTRPPTAPKSHSQLKTIPVANWPETWQKRLAITKHAPILWTYAQLGQDLINTNSENRNKRRDLLNSLLKDLNQPNGTHTFWPMSIDESNTINADIFWSGVKELQARAIVIFGPQSAKDLNLQQTLTPLRQIRHLGYLIWTLWDIDHMLNNHNDYTRTLAFLKYSMHTLLHW